MSAFVLRSLWEVPGTILVAIFLVCLGITTIIAVIRMAALAVILIVGTPVALRRGRRERAAGPITATYRSFTCPRCARTAHNLTDAAEGYCATCGDWTRREPTRATYDRTGSAPKELNP